MLTPTHIASGYLIAYFYMNNFNIEGVNRGLLTTIAVVASLAPDVDGLFGRELKDHRKTVFHSPLIWLVFMLIIYLFSFFIRNDRVAIYIMVFGSGVFFHLFLDWFGGRSAGIWIFYPFLRKQFSLFPLNPNKGKISTVPSKDNIKKYIEFARFYPQNKFLVAVEVSIIILAVITRYV